MADHSQKWHDRSSSRNIESSSDSKGIAAIVTKLENLDRYMKKLKENVHAIQVGYQICRGAHLDIDCPYNEEIKSMEEVKYGEFGQPFLKNDGRFNGGRYDQPSSGERRPILIEIINKCMEEASKRYTEQEKWLKKFYQRFSDNERKETDESRMAEALAALEATTKNKKFDAIYLGLKLFVGVEDLNYLVSSSRGEICLCTVSSLLDHIKLSQDGECCSFLKFVSSGCFRLWSSIFADKSDKEFLIGLIKREIVKRIPTSSHMVLLLQSRAMKAVRVGI
nr:hypothetical protein [Tanacetum cinerariifolium]